MTWLSRFVGRLMIVIALKGHFLGQIPQPIQRDSERKASRDSGVTSMPGYQKVSELKMRFGDGPPGGGGGGED